MTNNTKIGIAIVDDNIDLIIKSIQEKVQSAHDIKIVGTFEDGEDILDKLANSQNHPDLVIMDSHMKKLDGIPAARKIKKLYPHIKILMLTGVHGDFTHILMALNLGIEGYVSKNEFGNSFIHAIREIYNGTTYLSPNINRIYFVNLQRKSLKLPRYNVSIEELTEKDRKFLELLGSGKSFKEIQSEMNIGFWGRDSRLKRLKSLLNLDSIQALCAYAWRNSLCQ